MRGFRPDPHVYFGSPGQYVKLPWPRGGVSAPVDRQTFDFVSGSGNHRVSTLVSTSRSYTLSWNALHQSTFDMVNQFYLGHNGPGPFVYIDPSRPNLLTANQSSATGQTFDTTGFILDSVIHGSLLSSKDVSFIRRQFSRRSFQWRFPAPVAGTWNVAMASTFGAWTGIPVVGGESYAWSYAITYSAGALTGGPQVKWLDASGATLRTDAPTMQTWSGWVSQSIVALAPSNAAYAVPSINISGASVTNLASAYVDMLQFEMDKVVNDWAPGTGVLPVAMMPGFNEDMGFDGLMRVAPTLGLREIM